MTAARSVYYKCDTESVEIAAQRRDAYANREYERRRHVESEARLASARLAELEQAERILAVKQDETNTNTHNRPSHRQRQRRRRR